MIEISEIESKKLLKSITEVTELPFTKRIYKIANGSFGNKKSIDLHCDDGKYYFYPGRHVHVCEYLNNYIIEYKKRKRNEIFKYLGI